jgi:hypothetical protein
MVLRIYRISDEQTYKNYSWELSGLVVILNGPENFADY